MELLQDGNLSDGSGGNAFFLMLQPNLLDGNHAIRVSPTTSIDHTIGALSNLFKVMELQTMRYFTLMA